MAKYVLKHGGLSLGLKAATPGSHLRPSADPLKPTIVEMDEKEAAKVNGHAWDEDKKAYLPREAQLLHGSTDDGPCLVLLSEYEAEIAAEKAKAEVLAKAKAAPVEKAKGGKS